MIVEQVNLVGNRLFKYTYITGGLAWTIDADNRRRHLRIASPMLATDTGSMWQGGPMLPLVTGGSVALIPLLTINCQKPIDEIDIEQFGQLVQLAFRFTSTAGADAVIWELYTN